MGWILRTVLTGGVFFLLLLWGSLTTPIGVKTMIVLALIFGMFNSTLHTWIHRTFVSLHPMMVAFSVLLANVALLAATTSVLPQVSFMMVLLASCGGMIMAEISWLFERLTDRLRAPSGVSLEGLQAPLRQGIVRRRGLRFLQPKIARS